MGKLQFLGQFDPTTEILTSTLPILLYQCWSYEDGNIVTQNVFPVMQNYQNLRFWG